MIYYTLCLFSYEKFYLVGIILQFVERVGCETRFIVSPVKNKLFDRHKLYSVSTSRSHIFTLSTGWGISPSSSVLFGFSNETTIRGLIVPE